MQWKKAAHETLPKRNRPQPGWSRQNEVRLKSLIKKRNSALSLKISRPTRSSSPRLRKIRKTIRQRINGSLLIVTNLINVLLHVKVQRNIGILSEY